MSGAPAPVWRWMAVCGAVLGFGLVLAGGMSAGTGRALAILGWVLAAEIPLIVAWRLRVRSCELERVCSAFAEGRYDLRAQMPPGALAHLGQSLNRLGERLQASDQALRGSRALLASALGALEEGVVCIDSLDRVIYANPAYRRLIDVEEAVGRPLFVDLADPRLGEAIRTVRGGGTAGPFDLAYGTRHLRARTVIGDAEVVVVVLYDRSDVQRLEMRRRDFMSAISHELKTPLTSILGFSETALDDESMDLATMRGFFQRITHHAERLHALVLDIIMLSRLEEGEWPVRPTEVDLRSIGEAVFDDHREAATGQKVSLHLAVPSRSTAWTDPDLLRLLLANLISNAIRYNRPDGRVDVTLTADGDRLRVEVMDTGIGIPVEHQHRIFERFYRVDSHRSRDQGGTGLGLSIVKHLITRLGGRLELQSSPAGSRFLVLLPLLAAEDHEAATR